MIYTNFFLTGKNFEDFEEQLKTYVYLCGGSSTTFLLSTQLYDGLPECLSADIASDYLVFTRTGIILRLVQANKSSSWFE